MNPGNFLVRGLHPERILNLDKLALFAHFLIFFKKKFTPHCWTKSRTASRFIMSAIRSAILKTTTKCLQEYSSSNNLSKKQSYSQRSRPELLLLLPAEKSGRTSNKTSITHSHYPSIAELHLSELFVCDV